MKKTKLTRSLMAAVSIVALSAVMYGCTHSGSDAPQMEAPDLSSQIDAAAAAATAAMAASNAAATAVAGVAGISGADAASYVAADKAADAAMAAYMRAKAASADAAAAQTVEDADAAQAAAEAAQTAAEAARDDAIKYAGMVTQAKADADAAAEEAARLAAEAAAAEAMALKDARNAADMAADAAEMSASDAADDVAGVMDIAGSDQASYDAAVMARDAAMAAATAARNASDAANRATTSADAMMYQETAEMKRDEAATAMANAEMYAGMVTQAKADDDAEAERQRMAAEAAKMLADTKLAAKAAEDAAETAKNAAAMSVSDVKDSGVLETDVTAAAAFARAEDARDDAAAAHLDAVDANLKAQAAMSQEDATKYKNMAEAAKMAAENAQAAAARFAGIVSDAQMMADNDAQDEADEEQRMMDVASARSAAMQSYMDADADATKAEGQADAAEATASGSPGAMAARAAATAARTAATAAKAAHDAIMDDMTKAEADMQAAEAATQAGHANTQYMMAKAENDDIQTNAGQIAENNRVMAVNAATSAADTAAMAARKAAGEARASATSARQAANDARASYMKAMRARTDSANANAQYMAADEAATAAENAATAAEMAADDAEAAHMGIDPAGTAADAQAAQSTAEMKQSDAEGSAGTADTKYMEAKTAMGDAAMYAGRHVLELFKLANAGHIVTAMDTEANTDQTEAEIIARLKSTHRGLINTEIAEAADDGNTDVTANAQATTTVASTWNYHGDLGDDNAVGGEGANADSEPGEGLLSVSVTISGTAYTTTRGDNPDTQDEVETDHPLNFTPGHHALGDFDQVLEISVTGDDGATPPVVNMRTRVLVFTDKDQANEPVAARTAAVQNRPVSVGQVVEVDANSDGTYEGLTGAMFDHDNNPNTKALPGTFTCVGDPADCSIELGDFGRVTQISGYRFTSTGFDQTPSTQHEIVAGKASVDDATYLAFGVWLQDDADATDNAARYTFGAFAGGGTAYETTTDADATVANIEGTATYNGKAAGVHATASRMDYFEGDATLRANFREDEADALGVIIGEIKNIYSGGDALTGYGDNIIYLRLSDQDVATPVPNNISDTGTFSGRTRLGAGTEGDDGELDYPFNGTWQGGFYNQVRQNIATAADETEMPPMSAAGTFGVTMTDDMDTTDTADDVTESFVGAFGAHRKMEQ